jgi:hypothetical protein
MDEIILNTEKGQIVVLNALKLFYQRHHNNCMMPITEELIKQLKSSLGELAEDE